MKNAICYATEAMIPSCKAIWSACFGDEDAYIDFYFKHRFTTDNMLVYCIEERPVSMLSLLPAEYIKQGQSIPVYYVYAVATFPQYRGCGYAGRLLKEAMRDKSAPLILSPAEESLEHYYAKYGFTTAFAVSERCYTPIDVQQAKEEEDGQEYWLLTVTPPEYKKIRDQAFAQDGYVCWNEEAIAYALLENDFVDGYAYKVAHHGQEDILLYRMEDGQIKVLETTLEETDLLAVFKRLRTVLPITVRRPVTSEQVDAQRSFGMIAWGNREKEMHKMEQGYLNLILE